MCGGIEGGRVHANGRSMERSGRYGVQRLDPIFLFLPSMRMCICGYGRGRVALELEVLKWDESESRRFCVWLVGDSTR